MAFARLRIISEEFTLLAAALTWATSMPHIDDSSTANLQKPSASMRRRSHL
jgi:hypothetical protein